MKYIVTALTRKTSGRRDDISIPMSLNDAKKFKKTMEHEIKISNNMHGFFDIKIEKVPVLHWFNTGGSGTTCGLYLDSNIQTPTMRDHTTCRRCIASLKKAKLW